MRLINTAIRPLLALVAIALLGGCQSQQTFRSPDDAVVALKSVVEQQDKKRFLRLFGPNAGELQSGDPDQDRLDAIIFSRRLTDAHKIHMDAPDRATLLVGKEEWPFAVPLVMKGAKWQFDTDSGIDELTNRRIGRNELLTIEACRTLVSAQAEFFDRDPDGVGVKHYAARLLSTEGKKDGLYWPAPGGVDPSPIGPALAVAATRRDAKGERIPFNGYFFKMLTSQTASAPGGSLEYTENGRMTRGWAVVVYPAEYGVTGIMSFLCGHGGVVYQKDLGDETLKAVESVNAFDPASGWEKVEPTDSKQP